MARSFDTGARDNSLDSDRLGRSVTRIAFWSAVCLPFVQLSLLVGGVDSQRGIAAFGVLLVCNLVALVVGHRYRRE